MFYEQICFLCATTHSMTDKRLTRLSEELIMQRLLALSKADWAQDGGVHEKGVRGQLRGGCDFLRSVYRYLWVNNKLCSGTTNDKCLDY